MHNDNFETRLEEIRNARQEYPIFYPILLVTLLVGILIGIGFSHFPNFERDMFGEVISVIVTVGIINVIESYRRQKQQKRKHNILNRNLGQFILPPPTHKIFLEMLINNSLGQVLRGFDIKGIKLKGFKIKHLFFDSFNMRKTEWYDGDFDGTQFYWSDLNYIKIKDCSLRKSTFFACHLEYCDINSVSMINSKISVYIEYGKLWQVDFSKANLSESTMKNTIFNWVKFDGANLKDVDFSNSRFHDSHFDGNTILPDGSYYDISKGLEQLSRFIYPDHEDFYRVHHGIYSLRDVPEIISEDDIPTP